MTPTLYILGALDGVVAQLVERLNGIQEVRGSNPLGSTILISKARAMGMMKNYLLTLLEKCSEEQFGQDVIEWAIVSGLVRLSYDLDADVRSIMLRYDELIEAYRRSLSQANEELRKAAAPMKRAGPRGQIKAGGSAAPLKRKGCRLESRTDWSSAVGMFFRLSWSCFRVSTVLGVGRGMNDFVEIVFMDFRVNNLFR